MNFWDWLDRIGERRLRRAEIAAERPLNIRLLANVIGCSLVAGFLGALFTLFIIPIPPANEQIITYMVGQLSGFAGGVVAYHYTMSAGQKEIDAKRAETSGKAIAGLTAAVASMAAGGGAAQPDGKPDLELKPGETATVGAEPATGVPDA